VAWNWKVPAVVPARGSPTQCALEANGDSSHRRPGPPAAPSPPASLTALIRLMLIAGGLTLGCCSACIAAARPSAWVSSPGGGARGCFWAAAVRPLLLSSPDAASGTPGAAAAAPAGRAMGSVAAELEGRAEDCCRWRTPARAARATPCCGRQHRQGVCRVDGAPASKRRWLMGAERLRMWRPPAKCTPRRCTARRGALRLAPACASAKSPPEQRAPRQRPWRRPARPWRAHASWAPLIALPPPETRPRPAVRSADGCAPSRGWARGSRVLPRLECLCRRPV
jgi:hypothetical protein